jgi:hypothetical protein
MAERRQGEYWTDLNNESGPQSIKDRARRHEARREKVIVSILMELHMMAATGIISSNIKNLVLSKASFENTFGYSGREMMEVTCTPRRVLLNAVHVYEVLARVLPARGARLKEFFEWTDSLPVSFDICDTMSEEAGVVDAFRAACLSAIASADSSALHFSNITLAVKRAFDQYKAGANYALSKCIDKLEQKLTFPKPLPDNEQKWQEQVLILRSYAAELRSSTAVGTVTRINEVEKLIMAYKDV